MIPLIEDRENVGVLKTEFHVSSLLIIIAPFNMYVQDCKECSEQGKL